MAQHGADGSKQFYGSDISGGSVPLDSLIACSGCGAVFKKSKIIAPAVDPSAYGHITCPVCLKTQGWEPVQ